MRYDVKAVRAARSLLFVPGDRPERFTKAVAAQPDIVIIDLEDAVAETHKAGARAHAAEWLMQGNAAMLRVNAAATPWHADDLALAAKYRTPVMVAKATHAEQLQHVAETVPGAPIVPLVETAAGITAAASLGVVPSVARFAFGSIDLAAQLGVDPDDRNALLMCRSTLVLASAACALAPPIDGVTTALRDTMTLTDDVLHARKMGMPAKLCIHPAQVEVVRRLSAPSEADVHWARTVVAAAHESGDSAAAVDGKMIDRPVIERARAILSASVRSQRT